MGVLEELLVLLEMRYAAWGAAHRAGDHYRKVCEADERMSVIDIARQRLDAEDDHANRIERELDDFMGARANDVMEALRATVGKSDG